MGSNMEEITPEVVQNPEDKKLSLKEKKLVELYDEIHSLYPQIKAHYLRFNILIELKEALPDSMAERMKMVVTMRNMLGIATSDLFDKEIAKCTTCGEEHF